MTKAPYAESQCADLFSRKLGRIKVNLESYVLTITLNRPEKRNAFDPWMINELAYAMCFAKFSKEVRLVILRAEGPVFCSGADLKAFAGMIEPNPGSDVPEPEGTVTIGDLFRTLYKPCIAVVHGPVYAGGFLMICGCSHVISARDAKFGLPEVQRGIWPMQVMASLSGIVPRRALLDWCMRGLVLDAEKAYNLGVVTQLSDTLEKDIQTLSEEILAGAPTAIQNGMRAYDEMQTKSHEELHGYLQEMLQLTLTSEDAREGLMAFREKRNPVWPGK